MILKDQRVYVDGVELTSHVNSVAIDQGVEVQDKTPFGSNSRIKTPGLQTVALGLQGFYDAVAADKPLTDGFAKADVPVVVTSDTPAHGGLAHFFNAVQAAYSTSGATGEVFETSLSAEGNGALARGQIAFFDEALTASDAGAALNLGTVGAGQRLFACVQLFGNDDPADSVQVTINGDSADDFTGSETTHITFTDTGALSGQLLTADGPITDTWFRAAVDLTGASPSVKVLVTLAIV